MRRILTLTAMVLLGIAMVVFFFANRQPVLISFDPTSLENPAVAIGPMPFWAALSGTLFMGFALGGFGMWLSYGGLRKKAKVRKAEIRRLETELKSLGAEPPRSRSREVTIRG